MFTFPPYLMIYPGWSELSKISTGLIILCQIFALDLRFLNKGPQILDLINMFFSCFLIFTKKFTPSSLRSSGVTFDINVILIQFFYMSVNLWASRQMLPGKSISFSFSFSPTVSLCSVSHNSTKNHSEANRWQMNINTNHLSSREIILLISPKCNIWLLHFS